MPAMDRSAIERAEKLAERMGAPAALAKAVAEAKLWDRPPSLRTTPVKPARVRRYEFTNAQLQIAERSLNAGGAV
jgi:hypothetical protein